MNITPRQRVLTALKGDMPDKIPFTVYENMIPQCSTERELRNRGMCIVRRIPSYTLATPNVTIKTYGWTDERGRELTRTTYDTPHGQLSTLTEPGNNTTWTHEYMFKSPDDYKALLFYIKDSVIVPRYDFVANASNWLGEDFIVRDQIILEPLQGLISDYMGTETYCYEWLDNQDEIMKLYEARVELSRKIYRVVADSPLGFANYGGNVVPQIHGKENFRNYFVPHYNEAAEVLHKKGKLIGCHFDAENHTIMDDIAGTALDYIEAYDPGLSPSVKDARAAWPNKVLWLNWPSGWQLDDKETKFKKTLQMIDEAAPGNGFLIGITEDVPEELWQEHYTTIMDGIDASTI